MILMVSIFVIFNYFVVLLIEKLGYDKRKNQLLIDYKSRLILIELSLIKLCLVSANDLWQIDFKKNQNLFDMRF